MSSKKTKETQETQEQASQEPAAQQAQTSRLAPKPAVEVVKPSDNIWSDIKDLELNLYGLPKKVETQFEKTPLSNDMLYLKQKTPASASLPALEELVSHKYKIDVIDAYIIVSKKD